VNEPQKKPSINVNLSGFVGDERSLARQIREALRELDHGPHTDHQHIGTYDRGGWLKLGLTLVHSKAPLRRRIRRAWRVLRGRA
jgi:hypothetical protein